MSDYRTDTRAVDVEQLSKKIDKLTAERDALASEVVENDANIEREVSPWRLIAMLACMCAIAAVIAWILASKASAP